MGRILLFLTQAGAALALAACTGGVPDDRASRPLPPKLVAEMSAKGMAPSDPIFVRIFKQESELEIWKRDTSGRFALLKTYPICRWSGVLGPKKQEGDRQAPEGFYNVTAHMMNPRSQYHLSFDLGYPSRLEHALGYTGSALMVHGACTSAGCFALTDDGVSEIYGLAREAFRGGQPSFQVQALPFRMTAENLAKHRTNPNIPFWRNLKAGADYFEVTRQPPLIAYCERRYVFPGQAPSGRMDPLGPCPEIAPDASAAVLVAAKRARDDAQIALLSARKPEAASYVDGGMHPTFRQILRSEGPRRLANLTSAGIEVSQPDAALRDPFASETSTARALSYTR